MLIFTYSFLAAIVLGIDLFASSENNFFYAGEPVNLLVQDNATIIKFVLTFGVFYLVSYVGCSILYSFIKLNVWVYKALVFSTTSLLVVYVYPVVMHTIFPESYVTTKGGMLLIAVIVLIIVKQAIRREAREMERYHNPIRYFSERIVPWIKTGKQRDSPYRGL